MREALSLLARCFLPVVGKFLKVVPRRYRPYVKTTGHAMFNLPTVARGFVFGQGFEACKETETGASAGLPRVESTAHAANPLETYFDSHTVGAGIWKWRHYFEIYHRHLAKFVGREVDILEVGVYSGGSLDMWKKYFGPKCRVYGVDIQEECKSYEDEAIKIAVGDQAERNFWKRFKEEVPALDVVIDDGGHKTHEQIVTLEEVLSHLRPGGVYICEDVYGEFNPFHDYVSGLAHHLNAWQMKPGVSHPHEGIRPNSVQRVVHSVHLYPFMVVIEKRETSVRELVAPKQGTQWQPWLG
jgi:SAM-dependent methyltransferase